MGAQSRLKRVEERRCLGGHSGVSGKMERCTHAEFSKIDAQRNTQFRLLIAGRSWLVSQIKSMYKGYTDALPTSMFSK
jgi:hypothetical protein